MIKKKPLIITLIVVLVFLISLIFVIDRAANSPKYQQKLFGTFFKTFMILPDTVKSSIMILSGKRSFSNLFNDYNVKFLPETQYIQVELNRKKINLEKKSRNTFYIDTFKDNLIFATKYSKFYKVKFEELKNTKKNLNFEQFSTKGLSNLKGNIYDISVSGNKIYVSKSSQFKDCNRLEIYFAEII